MSEPLRELLHKAHELHELTRRLTFNAIAQDFPAMAIDVSAITTNTAEIVRITEVAQSGDSAAIQAAVAAAQESDQATVSSAATDQATKLAALTALFPPASTGGAGTLTVSPSPVTVPVGSTTPIPLTFAGNTGTISASGLPSGITFDGSSFTPDGSQVAGDSTVTFTDSGTSASASVVVTVS